MRYRQLVLRILVVALILFQGGCVELTGQRITLFYDSANDSLSLLISYDGIHESKESSQTDGKAQIPEFIKNGDVMFFDWPFHIKFNEIRSAVKHKSVPPKLLDFAKAALASVKVVPLGHYRDPLNRIGAVQLITITKTSEFIKKANAAFNEATITEYERDPELVEDAPKTSQRIIKAAKKNFQWISLKGHAVQLNFPAHEREWRLLKGEGLLNLFEQIASKEAEEFKPFVQFLSMLPVSYNETAKQVTLRIGNVKSSQTLSVWIRDTYNKELEKTVIENMPLPIDRDVACSLLEGKETDQKDAKLALYLDHAPPEDRVRAVLMSYKSAKAPEKKKQARRWLEKWSKEWNDTQSVPRAPDPAEEKDLIPAWTQWYADMLAFPLKKDLK